jgi:hypothetical protein
MLARHPHGNTVLFMCRRTLQTVWSSDCWATSRHICRGRCRCAQHSAVLRICSEKSDAVNWMSVLLEFRGCASSLCSGLLGQRYRVWALPRLLGSAPAAARRAHSSVQAGLAALARQAAKFGTQRANAAATACCALMLRATFRRRILQRIPQCCQHLSVNFGISAAELCRYILVKCVCAVAFHWTGSSH